MAALVAICTYAMRRFGAAHAFLYRVSERPQTDILKIVPLLLCFHASRSAISFSRRAYAIQQRKLVRLGRKFAALGGKDYSIQFSGLSLDGLTVAQSYQRLCNFARRLEGSDGFGNYSHINHASSHCANVPRRELSTEAFAVLSAARYGRRDLAHALRVSTPKRERLLYR